MHFKIETTLLPHTEPKYFHCIVNRGPTTVETICVMGQILQQMDFRIITKKGPIRNINELNLPAGIFTRHVRGLYVQSDIATRIMQVPYPLPPEKMKFIGEQLHPHHTIEFFTNGQSVYNSAELPSIDVVL